MNLPFLSTPCLIENYKFPIFCKFLAIPSLTHSQLNKSEFALGTSICTLFRKATLLNLCL